MNCDRRNESPRYSLLRRRARFPSPLSCLCTPDATNRPTPPRSAPSVCQHADGREGAPIARRTTRPAPHYAQSERKQTTITFIAATWGAVALGGREVAVLAPALVALCKTVGVLCACKAGPSCFDGGPEGATRRRRGGSIEVRAGEGWRLGSALSFEQGGSRF